MDTNEPVVLRTTNNPTEAELLKNLLEGEGIRCELEGENQASLAGVLGIKVLVLADDAERAREVLAAHGHHHKKHLEDHGEEG